MSALTLLEVGTQEPCSKGVHNVFLRINFGCHGSQRLKSEPFYIFLQPFFFCFIFCFVSISISVVLVNFARPSLLFTVCCDAPELFYWLLEYIMAEFNFFLQSRKTNKPPFVTNRRLAHAEIDRDVCEAELTETPLSCCGLLGVFSSCGVSLKHVSGLQGISSDRRRTS